MNEIECHPFESFFEKSYKAIIIGTFPCRDFKVNYPFNYGDWYYSGSSRNMLWDILSKIYSVNLDTRQEKENLLKTNKIGIADIAKSIHRKIDKCGDKDFIIEDYNDELLDIIKDNPGIKLMFTSKIAQNFTKSGFQTKYGRSYTNLEVALLPPSPSASRYIGSLDDYKEYKMQNSTANTKTFRVKKYKEHFILVS